MSWVAICNQALVKLGADRIDSLEENSRNAMICREILMPAHEGLLRLYPWNFALKEQGLPKDDQDTAFVLPQDCIKALWINNNLRLKFRIAGRRLFADVSAVNLTYIKQVYDPKLLDSAYIQALVYRLAADIAVPVSGNREVAALMEQLADKYLQQAIVACATEPYPLGWEFELTVINRALMLLGADTVTSIYAPYRPVQIARESIDSVLAQILSLHNWKFASKHVSLTGVSVEGWFRSDLPADFIRVVRVLPKRALYRIQGRQLWSDHETVTLYYVFNADVEQLPEWLYELVALKLAQNMAFAVTKDGGMMQFLEAKFQEQLRICKNIDSQSASAPRLDEGSWVKAHLI